MQPSETPPPEPIEQNGPEAKPATEESDAVAEGTEPEPTQVAVVEEALSNLQDDLRRAEEAYLRAVADLQNYRRRVGQELQREREAGKVEVVEDLLPILDNFERTLDAGKSGASLESLLKGVRLIEKQLRTTLERHGLTPIEAEGQPFDPELHEAVVIEHSDEPEGVILKVLERGYRLGDRVVRPAKAKVSKGPEK
ncbi:MAG: nucleotide exchange factor GrpE [Armatimonadota bacterium]